jgi:molecular chaperone GrpE
MKNIFSQKADIDPPEPAPVPIEDALPGFTAQDAAFSAVNTQCAQLEKEAADLRDQLLRRQAEFDNFRRRVERERAEYRVNATMDAVQAVLPVLDGLEQALKTPAHAGAKEIRKGVELVEKQLREILEKMGMTRIDAAGKPFDPNLHHAVEMVESSEHPDHTVLEVYQPGYFFQDKLLRPAMVRVAVQPPARTNEN